MVSLVVDTTMTLMVMVITTEREKSDVVDSTVIDVSGDQRVRCQPDRERPSGR